VVAGAGFGGYEAPAVLDRSWLIHWVRGPRTARLLGLPADVGAGDPAMLLSTVGWAPEGGPRIGFMPHFESAECGAWTDAAASAGMELIDPRGEPSAIIAAIGRCRVLLSEALHGVIVADTLRVPWLAVRPLAQIHRPKWDDWAETLDLRIEFHPLVASSLIERLQTSRLTTLRSGRRLLEFARPALRHLAHRRFVEQAAQALTLAAAAPPQLSAAIALDRCQARMLGRLCSLRRDPFRIT
jgi:succinoglycan biosynthesis protein ExoV